MSIRALGLAAILVFLTVGAANANQWKVRTDESNASTRATDAAATAGATEPSARSVQVSKTSDRPIATQPIQTSPVRTAQPSGNTGLQRADDEVRLVSVPVSELQVEVRGPRQMRLREQTIVDILVTSSAKRILDVAHLSTALGPGLRVRAISVAGEFDGDLNTMTWKLAHLLPGETRIVRMSVVAVEPGEQLQWVVAAPAAGQFVEQRHLTTVQSPNLAPAATYPTTATPNPPAANTRGAALPRGISPVPERAPWWQRYTNGIDSLR